MTEPNQCVAGPAPNTDTSADPPERRTAPVELLWDLVFVFAVTQVTTLLAARPTWGRCGESMLALALVWWAWSAFVWACNAQPEDSRALGGYLLTASVLIFVVGLALPQAFGAKGLLFAGAYALVRVVHLALYFDATRKGSAAWTAIWGFGVTVLAGIVLLVAGTFLAEWPRALLWTAAAAIDYAGPGWLNRKRLRGLQRVSVAHFAERYGSFVIISLGESVVAIGVGVGTAHRPLSFGLVIGAALALLIAGGLWWIYFDRIAALAQDRLRAHEDPVLAASDGYSYIHLVIVAGIIIFAVGVKLVVRDPVGAPMPVPGRLAMCSGVALYLLGLGAFRLRMLGQLSVGGIGAVVVVLALFALGGSIPAWSLAAAIAVLVGMLCVAEAAAGPEDAAAS